MLLLLTAALLSLAVRGQSAFAAEPVGELSLSGFRLDADAQALDLSQLDPAEVKAAIAACSPLTNVKTVELMDEQGESAFTAEDVRALKAALPDAAIHYVFELFGQRVSTLDENVVFDNIRLEEADEAALSDALEVLKCTRFVLDKTVGGMRDETLARLRDDYPERGLVWRVYFAGQTEETRSYYSALTDEEILRLTWLFDNRNVEPLKYFTNAVYLDIGHNGALSDLSFAACMPRLECLIASGSLVADIFALANCPDLTWAEFCFCGCLEDLSPLAGLEKLKYLNISYCNVKDIRALEKLPLERLVAFFCPIPPEQQEQFLARHPDCLAGFVGDQPYGYPWRYNAEAAVASDFFPYYSRMRELFLYDDPNYFGNNRYSPYGPGYLSLRPYNLVFGEDGTGQGPIPYQRFVQEGTPWPAP